MAAELVVVPAGAVGRACDAAHGHFTAHFAARDEVVKHVLAAVPLHDAVLPVTDGGLLQREGEVAAARRAIVLEA